MQEGRVPVCEGQRRELRDGRYARDLTDFMLEARRGNL
jgi:hypothetical protein